MGVESGRCVLSSLSPSESSCCLTSRERERDRRRSVFVVVVEAASLLSNPPITHTHTHTRTVASGHLPEMFKMKPDDYRMMIGCSISKVERLIPFSFVCLIFPLPVGVFDFSTCVPS